MLSYYKLYFGYFVQIFLLTYSAINCSTIVLDSNTGDAVFFKINPFSQQYFEVDLVESNDLNVVVHLAEQAAGMQLRASFCHQHDQDFKLIADNIGGSISRLLTHEELLGLKSWTSCSTNNNFAKDTAVEKNPRKIFLGLFFQPQPAYAQLTKRIQELDVSISAKSLPIFSSPSNAVRSRRGMQPENNQPITDYSLMVVNETKVLEFALHNFSLPINVSVTRNLDGINGPDVQVFASICAGRIGVEPVMVITSSSHYNSALLKSSALMPADLDCKFDVANPKLLLSLRLDSVINHTLSDTGVSGTVAVWQSQEREDGGAQNNEENIWKHWRQDIRLAKDQSVDYELQREPVEVDVNVRLGAFQIFLYPCANSNSKPQPILLGNFTGVHHIPLNWTLLQANCTLNEENILSNDFLIQDLLQNTTLPEVNQTNSTGLTLSLIGIEEDNIAWIHLNYNSPINLLVVETNEDDSSSSICPILLLVLFFVVIAIGLVLMAHQLAQRRRKHRYRIQRKVVLQRQNSLRPSAHNQLRVPTTSGLVITSTDTDTNISAFEMSDRGWAT
uniref:Uncharacterized protein n=1 Tax=Ditylenchus dipsaci TaxID=166011 RepID=A0A915EAA6_9BILA